MLPGRWIASTDLSGLAAGRSLSTAPGCRQTLSTGPHHPRDPEEADGADGPQDAEDISADATYLPSEGLPTERSKRHESRCHAEIDRDESAPQGFRPHRLHPTANGPEPAHSAPANYEAHQQDEDCSEGLLVVKLGAPI